MVEFVALVGEAGVRVLDVDCRQAFVKAFEDILFVFLGFLGLAIELLDKLGQSKFLFVLFVRLGHCLANFIYH
jgi:hypothetical protein